MVNKRLSDFPKGCCSYHCLFHCHVIVAVVVIVVVVVDIVHIIVVDFGYTLPSTTCHDLYKLHSMICPTRSTPVCPTISHVCLGN